MTAIQREKLKLRDQYKKFRIDLREKTDREFTHLVSMLTIKRIAIPFIMGLAIGKLAG